RYPNYRLFPLPETPFPNVKIIVGEEYVRTTRATAPYLSFDFTHPLMCHAFQSFADRLEKPTHTDRNSLRRRLENRYLIP
ncbi:MAG: hypothetical protein K5985_07170, partial [Lachnospiraceae bacterium]|nr:hypothetical protein [Lachnospiraceae bacterium]